jgi:hypothetical protein
VACIVPSWYRLLAKLHHPFGPFLDEIDTRAVEERRDVSIVSSLVIR